MSNHSTLPGPKYQALLQLLRTSETLWNASRLFFARWNLSPSQFNVLNLLADEPEGRSQIDISRLLIMHRSNATGLIDRLEKRRLLQRKATPQDRRAYRVVLTAAGRQLLDEILPEYYRIAERTWDGLSGARIRPLLDDLSLLSANVEEIEKNLTTK